MKPKNIVTVLCIAIVAGSLYFFNPTEQNPALDSQVDLQENSSSSSSSAVNLASDSGFNSDTSATSPATITHSVISQQEAPSESADQAIQSINIDDDDSPPSTDTSSALDDNNQDQGTMGVSALVSSSLPMSPASATLCSFPTVTNSSRRIILNEIAWMGTPLKNGETDVKPSEREWIELKNTASTSVDVSGWKLLDSAKNISVTLADTASIPAGGFYLLARGGGQVLGVQSDASYVGTLPNAGDQIALLDASCGLSDIINASSGWPGGNNITKQTLERDRDGVGWHTSVFPGGTPRAENSIPLAISTSSPVVVLAIASDSTQNATETNDETNQPTFPNNSSSSQSSSSQPVSSSSLPSGMSTVGASGVDHMVIAAVQIAGASSSNDFVKIMNPTNEAIDISNWKLHKKSSTGTDYSLRDFPTGSIVAPGEYFLWANSLGGFSAAMNANVSSTETLSADNSVGLFNASGTMIDAVAWGTGTNQYVEGPAFPTDPTANQVLIRLTQNGSMVDTNNNASDFQIQ